VGEANSPDMQSHPNSSQPVTKVQNNGIKMGEHEMSKHKVSTVIQFTFHFPFLDK
jgi:hypothetical protein